MTYIPDNNPMGRLLGFSLPITTRFLGGPSISMPALPDPAEQSAQLAKLMEEQRRTQEDMYERRQDEVREQEEARRQAEKLDREQMTREAAERESQLAEAERLAQEEASASVTEEEPEDEQLIYGFYGLYGDYEEEDDEYSDDTNPE